MQIPTTFNFPASCLRAHVGHGHPTAVHAKDRSGSGVPLWGTALVTKTFFTCGSCDEEAIEIFANGGKAISIRCSACENIVTLCPWDLLDNFDEFARALEKEAGYLTAPSEEVAEAIDG